MRKKIALIFSILLILFGLLFLNKEYQLTSFHIPLFSVPNGDVRVDFINNTNEEIKSIYLSTYNKKIEDIKIGERRSVTFKHSGEGSYQFEIDFESGVKIEESERYIERGNFITETIYPDKVKTDY